MSINISEIDTISSNSSVRSDGAPRSVLAKQKERDTLATDIERFLSRGGHIEQVAVGATGRVVEH